MKKQLFTLMLSALFVINKAQVVTTFAGSSNFGPTDGTGTAASFYFPSGVCIDATGNMYVADQSNHTIRKITSTGVVTTIAGSANYGSIDGTGTAASFNRPAGICLDAAGNLYVTERINHKIRMITPTGVVTTFAGSGVGGSTDGTGTAASFNQPIGICIDAAGNLYVGDQSNHKIRMITPTGVVTTLAGSGTAGSTDATGTAASFEYPKGVCVDASGNVYVADSYNNKIRMITPTGVVTTFAGDGSQGSTDGTGSAASFNSPEGVYLDGAGNIYVADASNHKIRMVTSSGIVSTIAGSGTSGSTDATGTAATFNRPAGTCLDAAGNLYVVDQYNHKIRKISSVVTSVNTITKENNTLTIYPNPSKGLYHIELLTDAELTITNILGEVISTQKMNAGNQVIDIQNQVNGVYFIKVSQNQQQQVIKLIKE